MMAKSRGNYALRWKGVPHATRRDWWLAYLGLDKETLYPSGDPAEVEARSFSEVEARRLAARAQTGEKMWCGWPATDRIEARAAPLPERRKMLREVRL